MWSVRLAKRLGSSADVWAVALAGVGGAERADAEGRRGGGGKRGRGMKGRDGEDERGCGVLGRVTSGSEALYVRGSGGGGGGERGLSGVLG